MAEVNTSIYQNQPNPLGAAQGVFNLLNTARQNELLATATQQRAFELQQSQANDLRATVGSLANNPNLTQAQLKAAIADRARQLQIDPNSPVIGTMMGRYSSPDWQSNLKLDATSALGPEKLLQRETATLPSGATVSIPSTGVMGQNVPTGNPYGASVSPEVSAKAGAGLESSATDTASQRFALNTLRRDLDVAGGKFGPTLPWEKKLNQLGARFGTNISMSKEELGATESFDKVVTTLADSMSRANGSDARLDAQFHSLPTSSGSAFGQKDIIEMLKGAGPDLTDAKRNIWFQYKKKNPAADFNQFNNDFNNEIDVRVFHLNNLDPAKRRAYLESLPEGERVDLAHRWAAMYNDGVVIDGQKYKLPLIKRPTLQ